MLKLSEKPTLQDYQNYVKQLEIERGFADQNAVEKSLLLGEEIGELFKAIRKATKMSFDNDSKAGTIAEELADIIIYICAIANRFDVDLEQAFREKEEKNKGRKWE